MTERSSIGASPRRREDARFLTGQGAYLDDLRFPDLAHAVLLRSPHAHARIAAIDTAHARATPGVRVVLTAADVHADGLQPLLPTVHRQSRRPANLSPSLPQPLLAGERVRHVGEAVALIVADTHAQALDAAELVAVEYDPLPSVTDSGRCRGNGRAGAVGGGSRQSLPGLAHRR